MKIIYILIIVICSFGTTHSQQLTVFDTKADKLPYIHTKLFAKDNQGHLIHNLTQSDISVTENGIKRNVISISCPPEGMYSKLSSVLSIDISQSMDNGEPVPNIDIAKAAARRWVATFPTDGSECALTSYSSASYLNTDFTTDKNKLTGLVNNLHSDNGTNYNAAFLDGPGAALTVISRAKYKRVVVFITDGRGYGNDQEIIRLAKDLNTRIFCVGIKFALPEIIKKIAEKTNGIWFEQVNSVEEIEQIYDHILNLSLEYEPCELVWETDVHCLHSRTADIVINNPSIQKKVSYTVEGINLPKVKLSTSSVRFSDIPPGKTDTVSITVTAESDSVVITSITSSGSAFVIENDPAPEWKLNRGESKSFRIRFVPSDSLLVFAQINITGNVCDGAFVYAIGGYSGKRKPEAVLKVISPNGGEKFSVGDTATLRWSGVLPSDTVSLDYSTDSGLSWLPVTNQASGLSYLWKIPPTPSTTCLFRAQLFRKRNSDSLLFLNGHTKAVNQGCFNNEGTQAVTVSNDKTFIIWDVQSGKQVGSPISIKDNTQGYCVDWSPDGKKIVIGGNQGACLYDVATLTYLQSVSPKPKSTYSCAFSSDGRYVLSTGGEGLDQIIVWGPDFNPVELPKAHTNFINRLTVSRSSPNHITVLTAGQDQDARRTEIDITADPVNPVKVVGSFVDLTSTDFCRAYVANPGNPDTTCAIFNKTGQLVFYPSQAVLSLFAGLTSNDIAWSPDGKYIAVALQERLEIIDLAAQKVTRILDTIKASATSIRWDVYSSKVLATFDNNQGLIWQINDQLDQKDVSDSLWEIVQPTITSQKDIDFGKVVVKTSRDSVVESIICVTGNPLSVSRIDSALIINDPDNVFRIVSSLDVDFSKTLPSCLPMELGFSPKKTGIATATLQLFSNGQIHEVTLTGTGFDLEITYPEFVDFGKIPVGASKDTLINPSTTNPSKFFLNITRTSISGPDTEQFIITGGDTSIVLNYQQVASLRLRFKPNSTGRTSSRVRIDFFREGAQPTTGTPIYITLIGEGICGIDSSRVFNVGLGNEIPAVVGAMVEFPIEIKRMSGQTLDELPTRFSCTLSFDASMLLPIQIVAPEGTLPLGTIDGTRRVVRFESERLPVGDTLIILQFATMLGSDSIVRVNIDSLNFTSTGCPVTIKADSVTIKFIDLCTAGNATRLLANSPVTQITVLPNPADEIANIQITLAEDTPVSISLHDALGREVIVKNTGVLLRGVHQQFFDSSQLPSGVYSLMLSTSSEVKFLQFVKR